MSLPGTWREWPPFGICSRILAALLLWTAVPGGYSQVSTRIGSITPSEAFSNTPFTLNAELLEGQVIEKVFFAYRSFAETEFHVREMNILVNTASITVPPGSVLPPFIEYYFVLVHRTGTLETYPLGESADPFSTPPEKTLQLSVYADDEREPEAVFLTPEPASRLPSEDVLISISLLRADSTVVPSATQLLLDGVNVTADAVLSDDIIVYAPENLSLALSPGLHKATALLYDRGGNLHFVASVTFTVIGQEHYLDQPPEHFKYGITFDLESRHEQVSDEGTWYNRANLQLNGKSGIWRLNAGVFVTSDERQSRQPQNRYHIGVEAPWIGIGYGDTYPVFPNLVLNGKRLRGLHSSVRLDFFNIDVALGTTERAVEGNLLGVFHRDSLYVEQQRDRNAAYAQINDTTWGRFRYGTFARDLFAFRPSFGSGQTWQLGFTWLKAKDDVASIAYGTRPQENLVVGTDFIARLDQNQIEISGEGVFSAFNTDISSGTFTDAYIDSVYKENAKDVKDARNLLGRFITVNDNLRPLSLNNLATAAWNLALGLNYFHNAFKFTYLYHGSDYTSFGQTFLRKDIHGFHAVDRIQLADNRVLLTAGYERLRDNTNNSKVATTTFSNFNIAVSYYPRSDFPTFTAGLSDFASNNGLSPGDSSAVDDVTLRLFLQSSYGFELGARHTASVYVATSNRKDRSPRQFDVRSVTLSCGVSTRYSGPVQTALTFTFNDNEYPASAPSGTRQSLTYSTVSLSGRYSILDETVSLLAAFSPTLGDFKRTTIDVGTEWNVVSAMSVFARFSYFDTRESPGGNTWSLRYRYHL